jgi:hypothetical protein
MAMQNELRCRKHSVRTVPKISRPSMTIGTFDSDGKPFVSLYPFNLTRKWGVSNYFFLGGGWSCCSQDTSREEMSQEKMFRKGILMSQEELLLRHSTRRKVLPRYVPLQFSLQNFRELDLAQCATRSGHLLG